MNGEVTRVPQSASRCSINLCHSGAVIHSGFDSAKTAVATDLHAMHRRLVIVDLVDEAVVEL